MKMKNIIITTVMASLSIGAATFALTKGTTLIESKANYDDHTSIISGYFERITDPTSIEDGEELLMVGGQNATFRYQVGASYHYWVTTEGSGFDTYSKNYIYFQNKKTELITFKKNSNGSYYLYLRNYADNCHYECDEPSSGYIVHEHIDHDGVTSFGDLYIRGAKDRPSAAAAQWYLNFVGDSMRITTSEGSDSRLLVWKSSGSSWSSWDSFIASEHTEWTSNINLYRKINPQHIDIVTSLDTNQYGLKDTLRTNNIYANILVDSAIPDSYRSINLYASECPRFFEIDRTIDYDTAGTYQREVKFKPTNLIKTFNIEVIDSTMYHFTKVKDNEKDYRGTYLAIAESSGKAYYSGQDGEYQSENGTAINVGSGLNTSEHKLDTTNFNLYRYTDFSHRINAERDAAFMIIVEDDATSLDTYYMRNYRDTSTFGYSTINLDDFNSYLSTNPAGKWPVTIVNGTLQMNGFTLKYHKGQGRFGLTDTADGSTWETAVLYRLELNEETISEADYYRENNFSYIRDTVCQMDGHTDRSELVSAWTGLDYKYFHDVCSPDAQYYLSNLIYTHNTHDRDTNESMMDCYDYILNKYGELESRLNDFMFRRDTGTYQENSADFSPNIKVIMGDNKVAVILVAVSILSISVLGTALLIKRRKEQ